MQWPRRPEVRSSDPEHPPAHSLIALQPIPLAVTRAHTPSSLTLQPYSSTCSTQTHCSWRHRGAARTRGKQLPQSAHSSLAHACTGNSLGDSTRQSLSCCAVRFTAHLAWQLRLLQQPPQPRSPIRSLPPARTLSHLFFLCRWIYFILYRDTLHALLHHGRNLPWLGAAHRADRRSSRGAVRRRRPVGPSPSARRRQYAGGGYGDAPGGAHAAAVTGGSGSRPARGDAPVCPVRQTSPHRTCGSMHA